MKKILLTLGLFVAALSANSQVFQYGFETPPLEDSTKVGYYQTVNMKVGDIPDPMAQDATPIEGVQHMMFANSDSVGNTWDRSLRFLNLPLKSNTAYRVSYFMKAPAGANVETALRKGKPGSEVRMVATGNTEFNYAKSDFSDAEWRKASFVFYVPADSIIANYYKTKRTAGSDTLLKDEYALTINMYTASKTYNIDDIRVQESTIAGVSFNMDVLKVNFGYAINGSDLVKGLDYGTRVYSPSMCKVFVNSGNGWEEKTVESVEIVSSGALYIFLADYMISETDQVKVSFTNLTDATALKYTANLRPDSWNPADTKLVKDFADEEATFDPSVSALSVKYKTPLFRSSEPEDGSFDLKGTLPSFKLVFNKKVDKSRVQATLTAEKGAYSETLTVANAANSDTLLLNRPSATELADGYYTINVSKICGEYVYDYDAPESYATKTLRINITKNPVIGGGGAVVTVMVDSFANCADNTIPKGWMVFDGEGGIRYSGTSQSLGNRMFSGFTGLGTLSKLFYVRSNSKTGALKFGNTDGYNLHLMPGTYQLSYKAPAWKGTPSLDCSVFTADSSTILITKRLALKPNLNGAKAYTGSDPVSGDTLSFTVETEGNYKYQFAPVAVGGMQECLVGDIRLLKIPADVPGATYKSAYMLAMDAADTLMAHTTDSVYMNTAYYGLKQALVTYRGVAYTSPAQYTAVTKIINDGVNDLSSHIAAQNAYTANVATAKKTVTDNATSKYNVLAAYKSLCDVVAYYDGRVLHEQADLKVANDTLTYLANYFTNMSSSCIPLLTERQTTAVTIARRVGVSATDADIVAVPALITDDDAIAKRLTVKIGAAINDTLAVSDSAFFFKKVTAQVTDPLTLELKDTTYAIADSIDMTCFLKNAHLYSTSPTETYVSGSFPGWSIGTTPGSSTSFSLSLKTATSYASATRPVFSSWIGAYEPHFDFFEQEVKNLPAGVYNFMLKARVPVADTSGTKMNKFMYVKTADSTYKVCFWGNANNSLPSRYTTSLMGLKLNGVTNSVTFGVMSGVSASTVLFDDFAIYMVGKSGSYTSGAYVGAADAVSKPAVNNGEVVKTEYFSVAGVRMAKLAKGGLTIVKNTYSDGSVQVSKVFVK
jgi:hypothetical protein